MRDCLGVSVGATNLVAARVDGASTVRPASVRWRGTALTGFVERVGDPVPIVAPDGSAHHADRLMAAALTDLIRTAGRPGETAGIALPAHWHGHVVARLRSLLPAAVITSDAVAALTALHAHPGLPARGVIVLCDFGATGTSVTLADASAGFATIGATARLDDFSGEAIDQSVLTYLLAGLDVDPASTSAVASLTEFRGNCRMAKERSSFQSATSLPGPRGSAVRITRAELESLVRGPLDAVLGGIEDVLACNGIRYADVVAVASVGGGSRIPVVTQCLSAALRMPVTTTPQAQSVAAIGAALIAGREPEMVTRVGVAPRLELASPDPVAPALLAWSTSDVAEPIDYAEFTADPGAARPEMLFASRVSEDAAALEPLPWYRRPAVLFAGAACAAVLAAAGLVVTTDVESVGTASAASVVSAVPSEVVPSESGTAPISGIPEAGRMETVVVTPPPTTATTTTESTTTSAPTTTAPTTFESTTTTPVTTVPPATTVTPTATSTVATSTVATSTVATSIQPSPPSTIEAVPPLETVLTTVPSQPVTAGDTASASR